MFSSGDTPSPASRASPQETLAPGDPQKKLEFSTALKTIREGQAPAARGADNGENNRQVHNMRKRDLWTDAEP